jgi:uncharacterized membrane protein YraQ (UPF0718 family)/copper chaperone CopZ
MIIETILNYLGEYVKILVSLVLAMSPYLLLGFLFAGILYIWFPRKKVYKYLGKQDTASVIRAALIGIPLPLCSCGVIPTGISLYNSGASKGSSVAFLISTPQTGPDSLMVTYSLLGLPMAIIRPVIALVTGMLGGLLTNIFVRADENKPVSMNNQIKEENKLDRSFLGMLKYAFVEFLEDIAKWLIIGLLIAALIDLFVPETFFTSVIDNEFLGMILILAVAVPLYVCATGSVPIAAVLMLKGLSPGAAIMFLMAGPATNAATITVIGKAFGRKTLFMYLLAIISGAFLFGVLVNELLPVEWFTSALNHMHHSSHNHGLLPLWLQWGSGILLTGLLINALIRKYSPFRKKQVAGNADTSVQIITMKNTRVIVAGMHCNHCKMTVENHVGQIKGIQTVQANISTGIVELSGEDFDLEQVREKIENLGYNYKGEAG